VMVAACSSDTPSTPSGSNNSTPPGTTSQTPTPTQSAADSLTGTWTGTYASTTDPASGSFTVRFTQTGSQLNGTIDIQNSACITTGTITGALNGDQITFGAVEGAQTITYTGSVSGNTMTGTYSAPQCGNGKGTWTATKTG
jgi:hypothetical protein